MISVKVHANTSQITSTSCDSCSSYKCPLAEYGNKDFCCPSFKEILNNNKFTSEELMDLRTICRWRGLCEKDQSNGKLLAQAKELTDISQKNSRLLTTNQIILCAFAETVLKELFLKNTGSYLTLSFEDSELIRKKVPWFNSVNNNVEQLFSGITGKAVLRKTVGMVR
jgi:hypothetical protein